jgi:hypothetical protein
MLRRVSAGSHLPGRVPLAHQLLPAAVDDADAGGAPTLAMLAREPQVLGHTPSASGHAHFLKSLTLGPGRVPLPIMLGGASQSRRPGRCSPAASNLGPCSRAAERPRLLRAGCGRCRGRNHRVAGWHRLWRPSCFMSRRRLIRSLPPERAPGRACRSFLSTRQRARGRLRSHHASVVRVGRRDETDQLRVAGATPV